MGLGRVDGCRQARPQLWLADLPGQRFHGRRRKPADGAAHQLPRGHRLSEHRRRRAAVVHQRRLLDLRRLRPAQQARRVRSAAAGARAVHRCDQPRIRERVRLLHQHGQGRLFQRSAPAHLRPGHEHLGRNQRRLPQREHLLPYPRHQRHPRQRWPSRQCVRRSVRGPVHDSDGYWRARAHPPVDGPSPVQQRQRLRAGEISRRIDVDREPQAHVHPERRPFSRPRCPT